MGAEPFASGDPAFLADLPDDVFGAAGSAKGESEFWTEADQARHGSWAASARPRRHRTRARAGAAASAAASGAVATAPAARPKPTLRGRLVAAWAAEASARRALRFRPEGAPKEPHKGRKVAVIALGVIALLAVGVATADLLNRGITTPEDVIRDESAGLAPGSGRSDGEADATAAGDDDDTEQTAVESEVIDPVSSKPRTSSKSPAATRPATTNPSAKPSTSASGTPSRPSGSTPASPAPVTTPATVPPTAAPNPNPAPPTTAPPATTTPQPVRPTVQAFSATPATSPGGACPALQWATTLRWNTTSATSVAITGLLEQTLSSLPGDGSKTVCRLLPGGPLGGWTLTATGPGGNTTANA